MASKDWAAFEAARELLNPKNIKSESVIDIGSRYPLFTKAVLQDGTESLVQILTSVPKLKAAMIEDGMRGTKSGESKDEAPKKRTGRPPKKKEPEEEADESEDSDNPYEGKSAKELYTMCKERGLKVKTKQPASAYAEVLMKDDESKSDDDADDWEEEEEEEKAKPKKRGGRPAKSKAKEEPEEDEAEEDDDDWEI